MTIAQISTGSKIAYSCALGRLEAEVTSIVLSPAADGSMQPWMNLEYVHPEYKKTVKTRIHASHSSLLMFKVEVL